MSIVWKNVGPLAKVPRRGARRLCFEFAGAPIALFRTSEDRVFALVDQCPHRKGPLSEGMISGDSVTCPLHNWAIDLRDGNAVFPDEGRTPTLPVRIVDGSIHVGLPIEAEQDGKAA